jgi:hypothetical protein
MPAPITVQQTPYSLFLILYTKSEKKNLQGHRRALRMSGRRRRFELRTSFALACVVRACVCLNLMQEKAARMSRTVREENCMKWKVERCYRKGGPLYEFVGVCAMWEGHNNACGCPGSVYLALPLGSCR